MFRRLRDFFSDMLRQTDLVLLALCAAASLFGVLMVASATRYMHTWRLVAVQSAALLLGVILYLLVSQVDLNDLSKYWKWIFLTGLVFILLLVTPLGIEDNTGNRAWLDFPFLPVQVQPAEIVKLTLTLVLAKQLAWLKENRDLSSIPSILFLGVHFGVIFLLYYKVSSDMGSALVFLFIFICMCFVAGVALHWFAIGGVLGGVGFWALWDLNKMPKYMKLRFQVLFDHTLDVQNTGWQQTRSLMALGMDRSLFGDLMVEDGTAYLLAMPEAAKSLQDEWHEAGHTAIRVRLLDAPPQFTPPQGAQMRDTVASLRLDCVLAAGMSLSRARAAEIIRQGLVQRNHTPEERVDTLLEAGDLLSIRGFGRIRLTEIGGRTRKDRISIQLEVFKRERSS